MPQDTERHWFRGFGWMDAAAIAASEDRIIPTRLAEHLRTLVEHGPPPAPIPIGR